MFDFLTSLLLFVFGFGFVSPVQLDPVDVILSIEESISQFEEQQETAEDMIQNDSDEHEEEIESFTNQENVDTSPQTGEESEFQSDEDSTENKPNTGKVRAFNTASGKVIESVAAVAVEKAKPLISCHDLPVKCREKPLPTPTPTLRPEPTPTLKPLPEPLPSPVLNPPKPSPTLIPWPPCPDPPPYLTKQEGADMLRAPICLD